MARYRATFDTPCEREDVFAYLSDFSTTEEWDPGRILARELGGFEQDKAERLTTALAPEPPAKAAAA
jgi:hypothetical protein